MSHESIELICATAVTLAFIICGTVVVLRGFLR